MWVLEDWWPTIRDLTLYWEFRSEHHKKRQYEWHGKISMAYIEEKGKSHNDLWGLWSVYFIWLLGASYYQGGCIGWISEVQIIEIYLQTKNPRKTEHIWVSDQIPESLAGHI
jgi:hypothetical protein